MSAETREWLSQNTLIGFTEKRGTAWHYREGDDNHFEGPVPRERVEQLLDFELIEATITATDGSGNEYAAPNLKAIVREDTGQVFHVPSAKFEIHQPFEWCVERLDDIHGAGLEVGSVVVLRGGALVSVQAEYPETRQSAEGIEFRPFLNAATANDGTMATCYFRGAQAVVCDNTFTLALAQAKQKVSVQHRRGSTYRTGEVRRFLGIEVEQVADAFDEQIKLLTSQFVSDEMWNAFVKAYTGVDKVKEGRAKQFAERKVGQLNRLWRIDPRVAPWRNNAWGVLAAVNTAQHHMFGPGDAADHAQRNVTKLATGKWERVDASTLKLLATVS